MMAGLFLSRCRQQGFTLVEAILVMVITGILAGMVALFIRMPVQNYVDSAARAELTDTGEFALRRIARDLRAALPNSVRRSGSGHSLEFFPTKTGGRYLAAEDEAVFPAGTNAPILSFSDTSAAGLSFTVIGAMPAGTQSIVAGDMVVVYNLGDDYPPSNAYSLDANSLGNRATVAPNGVNGNVITLQAPNPFVNVPAMSSPAHRFQVVTTPVTYYCNGRTRGGDGTLVRISNYGIVPVQADPPEVNNQLKAILAKNVLDCSFDYTSLPNTHSALIGMTIILQRPDSTAEGSVTLHHQIHVDNTP